MKRSAAVRSAILLGVLAAGGASAQQAGTYGPLLSKETAGGSDEVIRGLISEGTPRMPAFKHYLERAEIDAIIAYLKTVPATATR